LNLALLTLVTMVTAVFMGHASTKVILKVVKKLFGMDISIGLRLTWERFFAYSALGFVFIIAYCIMLSIFAFLNQIGVSLLIGFLAIVESFSLVNKQKIGELGVLAYVRSLAKHLGIIAKEWRRAFLLGLFIVAIVWHFSPAIMLANYPGGDDRAYLFVTRQIVDKGGVPFGVDYPYAYPFMDHVLMSGFMVVASFFYNLFQTIAFPTSIPLIHLFLAQLYLSLIPVLFYLFTVVLSKDRSFSIIVGLTALFLWRSVLYYFSWGGEGESMGYFLVPMLALVDYKLNETLIKNGYRLRTHVGTWVAKLFLVVTAVFIHVYSAVFFIFLVVIVVPLITLRKNLRGREFDAKDKIKTYLKIVAPYPVTFLAVVVLVIAVFVLLQPLVIGSPAILRLYDRMTSSPESILNDYSQMTWTPSWLVFRSGYDAIYALQMLTNILDSFSGSWVLPFIALYILSVVYLRVSGKRGESSYIEGREASGLVSIIAGTGVIFFLFTQNSPFGWYYIPYPLARTILVVRLYYVLNVFIIYVEALPLYLIFLYARKEIARPIASRNGASHHGFTLKRIRGVSLKKTVPIALLVLILAGITLPPINSYYQSYVTSRAESVVTPNDLDAFRWIEANTPRNATFIGDASDAGAYVYIYTGRIVLPPNVMRLWSAIGEPLQDLTGIVDMLHQGNVSQQLFQLLKKYNISYIYVGERSQYGLTRFLPVVLIDSPQLRVEFHQGGSYVLKIIYDM